MFAHTLVCQYTGKRRYLGLSSNSCSIFPTSYSSTSLMPTFSLKSTLKFLLRSSLASWQIRPHPQNFPQIDLDEGRGHKIIKSSDMTKPNRFPSIFLSHLTFILFHCWKSEDFFMRILLKFANLSDCCLIFTTISSFVI